MTDATTLQTRQLEDQIHRIMGRQLRVLALFSVLLMVVGFVLGHYVAAFQVGYWAKNVEQQLAELEVRLDERLGETAGQVADDASQQVETLESELDQLRNEIARVADHIESDREVRAAWLARLSESAMQQRDQCLDELEVYRQRRRTVPVEMVVQCVQRLSAARLDGLSELAGQSPPEPSVSDVAGIPAAGEPLVEPAAVDEEAATAAVYFAPPAVPRATFISKSRDVQASATGPRLTPPLH